MQLFALTVVCGLCWCSRRDDRFYLAALAVLWIVIGFVGYSWRELYVKAPYLQQEAKDIWIEGVIAEVSLKDSSKKVLLEDLRFSDLNVPKIKFIKVTIKNEQNLKIGDRISFRGDLIPPPGPLVPDGFNYKQYAYFREIGALGFSTSKVRVVGHNTGKIASFVESLRQKIGYRIAQILPNPQAAIAKGMLVGDASSIDKATFEAIRKSGIAHIIAISGMHIVVVIAMIFFAVKHLLSAINSITTSYDIKKIAAVLSLILTFIYLQIAGSPVSAERAYIMSALVLFGTVIEREITPLRSINIAAIALLIIFPESLFSAGLQMSFAACYALIAAYEKFEFSSIGLSKMNKVVNYLLRVTLSSLIAGLATAPFVIFHFYQFSTYGIITNLLAVPLSDFIIMPVLILSLIAMPIGLDEPLVWIAGVAIDIMTTMAIFISELPFSSLYIPPFSPFGITIYALGLYLLCVLKSKLRLLGMLIMMLSFLSVNQFTAPKIIVDGKGKIFVFEDDGKYYVSNNISSRFSRRAWEQYLGVSKFHDLKEYRDPLCHDFYCNIEIKGVNFIFYRDVNLLPQECNAILISLSGTEEPCANKKSIFQPGKGSLFIWIDNKSKLLTYRYVEANG